MDEDFEMYLLSTDDSCVSLLVIRHMSPPLSLVHQFEAQFNKAYRLHGEIRRAQKCRTTARRIHEGHGHSNVYLIFPMAIGLVCVGRTDDRTGARQRERMGRKYSRDKRAWPQASPQPAPPVCSCVPRRVRPTPRRAPRPVAVGVDESRTDASSSLALESRPWSASFSACDLARRRRRGDVTERGTGDLHCMHLRGSEKGTARKDGTRRNEHHGSVILFPCYGLSLGLKLGAVILAP